MNSVSRLFASAACAFSTVAIPQFSALAQSTPVAYIYVSKTVSGGQESVVDGYSAAANGRLTLIPGSPFQENVTNLAVEGTYLFGTTNNDTKIDSFRIEQNGAIRYATTSNVTHTSNAGTLGPLFFDRTGANLYSVNFNASGYGNNDYKSLSVEKPVGNLEVVGNSDANSWLANPAAFTGSNQYAYTASCIQDMYWGIFAYKRNSSTGKLTDVTVQANPPTAPNGYFYCPSTAATDSINHVAIAMQPINQQSFESDRTPQIAIYTANKDGNLSTASTATNMLHTSLVSVNAMKVSPSGELLAIGGQGGLQIFHFNGGKQITKYTGLISPQTIDQVFWDNSNHLYAISSIDGKLFVFTVTPTSVQQAPGSPYSVDQVESLAVQSE